MLHRHTHMLIYTYIWCHQRKYLKSPIIIVFAHIHSISKVFLDVKLCNECDILILFWSLKSLSSLLLFTNYFLLGMESDSAQPWDLVSQWDVNRSGKNFKNHYVILWVSFLCCSYHGNTDTEATLCQDAWMRGTKRKYPANLHWTYCTSENFYLVASGCWYLGGIIYYCSLSLLKRIPPKDNLQRGKNG